MLAGRSMEERSNELGIMLGMLLGIIAGQEAEQSG